MSTTMINAQKSFHDFKVTTIYGEELNLADFKGKKVLVAVSSNAQKITIGDIQMTVLETVWANGEVGKRVIILDKFKSLS